MLWGEVTERDDDDAGNIADQVRRQVDYRSRQMQHLILIVTLG